MTQLMQLREDGYSFVSIDKALALIKNRSKEKFIVITFDDATDDMFANAFPILKNMQIPFTVYVTIDFLDKEGFISYKQLEILKDEPLCIIGSHTVSHSMLRYTDNAFDEICQSKVILESKLKKSVDHFAYPFGKLGAVSMSISCVKYCFFSSVFC